MMSIVTCIIITRIIKLRVVIELDVEDEDEERVQMNRDNGQ